LVFSIDPFGGAKPLNLLRQGKKVPLRVNPEQFKPPVRWSRRVDISYDVRIVIPYRFEKALTAYHAPASSIEKREEGWRRRTDAEE